MPKIDDVDEDGRSPMAALSLRDLKRVSSDLRIKLLSGRLDLSGTATDDRGEDMLVVLKCHSLVASAVCDVLRGLDRKVGDRPIGAYVFGGRWRRLRDDEDLVSLVSGRLVISGNASNGPRQVPVVISAPKLRRVEL